MRFFVAEISEKKWLRISVVTDIVSCWLFVITGSDGIDPDGLLDSDGPTLIPRVNTAMGDKLFFGYITIP